MREQHVGNRRRVAGDEVDHARRHAGRFVELHQLVGRVHGARGRLPDDGVAHQGGRGRKVRRNRGEVERRHRVDKAFEPAVLELVPRRVVAERLLVEQFLPVVDVEAPEIHDLGGRVDFRLERRLRLAEHRRGVQVVAPGGRQELGGFQDDGGAIVERPAGPFGPRGERRVDGHPHVLFGGLVIFGEDVAVIVRHHRLAAAARLDFLAADDQRDDDFLRGHRLQARLERGAFGRARRVGAVGIVDRWRNPPVTVEC